jgi:hypothetical protein
VKLAARAEALGKSSLDRGRISLHEGNV